MPNILQPERSIIADFVASVPLDLLNSMYFTFLAGHLEGVDDWPVETRAHMDPALRADMDLLFTYPRRQPGLLGALNDTLFVHHSRVRTVDNLLKFIRDLPADGTPEPDAPGIRGLATYALRWPGTQQFRLAPGVAPRDALIDALRAPELDLSCVEIPDTIAGPEAVLALFDNPEDVRARMLRVIRRFYDEHYRADEGRRLACMERSVAEHRRDEVTDVDSMLRFLTGRRDSCLGELPDAYTKFVFVPSIDVGVYNSCADLPPIHGLHYPCEPRFRLDAPDDVAEAAADTKALALVYRALADEQRIGILRILRDSELYAQEIVERTGLHQSVVSRHLSFMKAVGLLNVRRQNNMKFYSINTEIGADLRRAVDALLPAKELAR